MQKGLSFQEKYAAIGKQESSYEGVFITGVTSTGIFCRPSCRAKKPKAENVIFFDTPQQALQNGFRPCKICKPMNPEGYCPQDIKQIIAELSENPHKRIKDQDLRQRNIEPSYLRRWFQKHHSMTFHSYQKLIRINKAYNEIKGGNSITGSAFGVGYESLSGFNETYKNIFGASPSNTKDKNVINIVRFTTPLGPMFACATNKGLCLLEFTDRRLLEWEFKDLCRRLNAVILPGENKYLEQAQIEMLEYFNGCRKEFSVPLHMVGTDFQVQVWKMLLNIPYGQTWSYLQQAIKMENPKSVRAIATTNGYNKLGIIIPCHRVIGSNGDLTGYGGGLGRKKWLLDMEMKNASTRNSIHHKSLAVS